MGEAKVSFGSNTGRMVKRVKYINASGVTKTIKEGEPLCYNYDTTANILGYDKANSVFGSSVVESATTAEGYQNEGKFLIVENPAEGNLNWFAGAVVPGNWCGQPVANGDFKWLELFEPNGQIVAIRTNVSCTVGVTSLGVGTGGQYFEQVTGDGDPVPCALAEETVDRSSTNGLVLAKLWGTGQSVTGFDGFFTPSAKRNGRTYGFVINGDNFFQGVAGAQEYLVHMEGSKSVIASGDCYGGILKISGGNDVVQPTSYILRGINASVSNDGTLGQLDNFIGVKNDEGVATTLTALTIRNENYGTNTGTGSVFGGLDILLTPEGTMAEKSFGIRVRNNNDSLATEIQSVLEVSESGTNTGFTYVLNVDALATISAYASTTNAPVLATGDIMIPIYIAGGVKYLVAFADTGV